MKQPPANLEALSRTALESLVADLCATNASLEAQHAAIRHSHAIVSEALEQSVVRENALRTRVVELIKVGSREIIHLDEESCPDEVGGTDCRDPHCPACKILGA